MKKLIFLVWILGCMFGLSACNNKNVDDSTENHIAADVAVKQEQISVFSFCGESEQLKISNGVIVLRDAEDVFEGGDLAFKQTESFENIVSHTTSFYVMKNGEKQTILHGGTLDMEGSSLAMGDDLGKICGEGVVIGNNVENIDELKDNLWFELKTTDQYGEEKVYQIQLKLTEITSWTYE